MKLTVDASVFVAATRAEETHYLASREFLQQVQEQSADLFCPVLVLPECAAAIARATDDSALAEQLVVLVESFPNLRLVSLELLLARRAVGIAREHRLRGADSVYVAVAQAFDAALVTWDSEMLARSSDIVTTMTPSQWMGAHRITT
jgi:predicted nucleic acid-binding protein